MSCCLKTKWCTCQYSNAPANGHAVVVAGALHGTWQRQNLKHYDISGRSWWADVFQTHIIKNLSIFSKLKNFFFFVIKSEFLIRVSFHSAIPFHFLIFCNQIFGWDPSYWQNFNKHTQSRSSTHYSSHELLLTIFPGVQCNVKQIKSCVRVCVWSCTSVHAGQCVFSVA